MVESSSSAVPSSDPVEEDFSMDEVGDDNAENGSATAADPPPQSSSTSSSYQRREKGRRKSRDMVDEKTRRESLSFRRPVIVLKSDSGWVFSQVNIRSFQSLPPPFPCLGARGTLVLRLRT